MYKCTKRASPFVILWEPYHLLQQLDESLQCGGQYGKSLINSLMWQQLVSERLATTLDHHLEQFGANNDERSSWILP